MFQVTRKPSVVTKRVTSDVTNATNVNADVTSMSLYLGENETWTYEMYLQIGSGAGGTNFAFSLPAGATHRAVFDGMGATSTARLSANLTDTSNTANFNTTGSANGLVRIAGCVVNSTTAGTVQLRFRSGTDTQTSTVATNSYMVARRLDPQ